MGFDMDIFLVLSQQPPKIQLCKERVQKKKNCLQLVSGVMSNGYQVLSAAVFPSEIPREFHRNSPPAMVVWGGHCGALRHPGAQFANQNSRSQQSHPWMYGSFYNLS